MYITFLLVITYCYSILAINSVKIILKNKEMGKKFEIMLISSTDVYTHNLTALCETYWGRKSKILNYVYWRMHKQMSGSELLDLSFISHWEREGKREANLLNKRVLKWDSMSGTGLGIGGRVVSRTKSLLLSLHFLDDFKNIDEVDISLSLMNWVLFVNHYLFTSSFRSYLAHKWCYISFC